MGRLCSSATPRRRARRTLTDNRLAQGYETTRLLLRAGARVIIASRTQSKVDEAIKKLGDENSTFVERASWLKLDLSSLKQVKSAAAELNSREKRLDGIVNNAGVMASPYELTEVGQIPILGRKEG